MSTFPPRRIPGEKNASSSKDVEVKSFVVVETPYIIPGGGREKRRRGGEKGEEGGKKEG